MKNNNIPFKKAFLPCMTILSSAGVAAYTGLFLLELPILAVGGLYSAAACLAISAVSHI